MTPAFDPREAAAALARACPGGDKHRGGPRALCPMCLVNALGAAHDAGRVTERRTA